MKHDQPPPVTDLPRWRLLLDFDRPGAWQMAVDDALRSLFVPGRDRPLLRLYGWRPACLSLGYGQPIADVDRTACRQAGIDVVRRPTGGRAILHAAELTYAVVAAVDDPIVGGTIGTAYRTIAGGLLAGLTALGVTASLAPGAPSGDLAARRSGACFAAATRHEITWQGRKLIGSAQAQRHGVFLQHGSLPLAASPWPLATLLRGPATGGLTSHLQQVSATLSDILPVAPVAAIAAGPFADAFGDALGVWLVPDELSAAERALAAHLQATRYGDPTWTARH